MLATLVLVVPRPPVSNLRRPDHLANGGRLAEPSFRLQCHKSQKIPFSNLASESVVVEALPRQAGDGLSQRLVQS